MWGSGCRRPIRFRGVHRKEIHAQLVKYVGFFFPFYYYYYRNNCIKIIRRPIHVGYLNKGVSRVEMRPQRQCVNFSVRTVRRGIRQSCRRT